LIELGVHLVSLKSAIVGLILIAAIGGGLYYAVDQGWIEIPGQGVPKAPETKIEPPTKKGLEPSDHEISQEAPIPGRCSPPPPQLFAEMPKEAFPKLGNESAPQREAARKWCRENLASGKKPVALEWTASVKADYEKTGKGVYDVTLIFEKVAESCAGEECGVSFGNAFSLGEQKCRIILVGGVQSGDSGIQAVYRGCTPEETKSLLKFLGKDVKLTATITDVRIGDENTVGYPWDSSRGVLTKRYDTLPIVFDVTTPAIDGFLPKADQTPVK
jgi:hypothetical protein